MRDIIINKTEREGLLYLLFQDLKYKFGKFLNLHNFILRKKVQQVEFNKDYKKKYSLD